MRVNTTTGQRIQCHAVLFRAVLLVHSVAQAQPWLSTGTRFDRSFGGRGCGMTEM